MPPTNLIQPSVWKECSPTLAMSVVLSGVETYFVGYEMFSLSFRVVGKNTKSSSSERASEKGVTQEDMSVATVTEISAISEKGFEDAVQQGIARATKTLRNVEGAWVKDQNVMIEDGNITGYKVNLEVTFVLDD
jgi:dodecin